MTAGETTTLDKLMSKYSLSSDQIDSEIEEEDATYLAQHFDNVELYLMVFQLTPAEQADVKRMANANGNHIAMAGCLSFWRRHDPSKATLRTLLEKLLKLNKGEIASKVCNFYGPRSK